MLKRNYYCLVAGLPDLLFNENKMGFSSLTFRNELKDQLGQTDYDLVKTIFLPFDNKNLLNLLFNQNKPFHPTGNYSEKFLKTQVIQPNEIPDYMIRYIKWVNNQDSPKFSLNNENKLYELFYKYALQVKNEFLSKWFTFNLNLKNLITAMNCNRYNYDIKSQIIESEKQSSINTLLLNNRLNHDLFEEELPFAEQIFRIANSDSSMIEKEKSIDKIRWDYLDEEIFFHFFTIEKIISFVVKLIIAERWMKMDKKTGKELLNRLIHELKTSYKFTAEFSTVK